MDSTKKTYTLVIQCSDSITSYEISRQAPADDSKEVLDFYKWAFNRLNVYQQMKIVDAVVDHWFGSGPSQ